MDPKIYNKGGLDHNGVIHYLNKTYLCDLNVLHVEHILCVITNCDQHESHFSFLNIVHEPMGLVGTILGE